MNEFVAGAHVAIAPAFPSSSSSLRRTLSVRNGDSYAGRVVNFIHPFAPPFTVGKPSRIELANSWEENLALLSISVTDQRQAAQYPEAQVQRFVAGSCLHVIT